MSEDMLTGPENAAQMRQARRIRAATRKRGACVICKHRERDYFTAFGLAVCGISRTRIEEHCRRDGKLPKFEVDDEALKEFADKPQGVVGGQKAA